MLGGSKVQGQIDVSSKEVFCLQARRAAREEARGRLEELYQKIEDGAYDTVSLVRMFNARRRGPVGGQGVRLWHRQELDRNAA